MKRFLLLSFIIIFSLFNFSCNNETPQDLYAIGQEYFFEESGTTVKIDVDEENKRFILYYDANEQNNHTNFFSFTFSSSTLIPIFQNSTEFEYSNDKLEEIVFDENGYFCFQGDRIFYISYKNANDEIKSAILEETYDISFPFGTFIIYND